MGYVIGTDEAGYGPNLGPLVISATLWETPDGVGGEDLFQRLASVVAPQTDSSDLRRVVMADSKKLYTSGGGLGRLERGLWAALGLLDRRPRGWRGVWEVLAPEALDAMQTIPWYVGYDAPAPCDYDTADLETTVECLRTGMSEAGVRLLNVRSRAVFADGFNALIDRHGSKGETLSRQTLDLVARLMEPLPPGPVSVICDKHGGRNRYAPLLAECFPEWFIEIRDERPARSEYRFGPDDRRVKIQFRTKAESCLPVALASMASKYLRELAMRAFNDFWRRHVPNLRPTAGYPQDAKRFRIDIAEKKKQLHIEDHVLWRVR